MEKPDVQQMMAVAVTVGFVWRVRGLMGTLCAPHGGLAWARR